MADEFDFINTINRNRLFGGQVPQVTTPFIRSPEIVSRNNPYNRLFTPSPVSEEKPNSPFDPPEYDTPALRAYSRHIETMPLRENYQPSMANKILSAIAGFSTLDPAAGVQTYQALTEAPYRRDLEKYNQKAKLLSDLADIEQKGIGQQYRIDLGYTKENRLAASAELQRENIRSQIRERGKADWVDSNTGKRMRTYSDGTVIEIGKTTQTPEEKFKDFVKRQEVFQANRLALARQRLSSSQGRKDEDDDALVAAIMANPPLADRMTARDWARVGPDLAARGFTGFGKPMGEDAIKRLTETRSGLASLYELKESVKENMEHIGPIVGWAKYNPWNEEARAINQELNLVKQRVGKALEGGVLRKEDELKYKEILATMFDTPELALDKLDYLVNNIESDIKIFLEEQKAAGRRTSTGVESPSRLEGTERKIGEVKTFPNGKKGRWDGKNWVEIK